MGKLEAVWTDLPDPEEEIPFKSEFGRFFGAGWDEVMLGAENPYSHHMYWDGYFSVREIKRISEMTVHDLPGTGGQKLFNIIVG